MSVSLGMPSSELGKANILHPSRHRLVVLYLVRLVHVEVSDQHADDAQSGDAQGGQDPHRHRRRPVYGHLSPEMSAGDDERREGEMVERPNGDEERASDPQQAGQEGPETEQPGGQVRHAVRGDRVQSGAQKRVVDEATDRVPDRHQADDADPALQGTKDGRLRQEFDGHRPPEIHLRQDK